MSKKKPTPRHQAAQVNPFVGDDIQTTACNVAAGLRYLSYAAGQVHECSDETMANGLDLLLQTMGKALDFETTEG